MSSFSSPKVKPDKATQAAAARQSELADNALTESLQSNLVSDTRAALRAFGLQPGSPSYPTGYGNGGGYGSGFGGFGGRGGGFGGGYGGQRY
jgi:hypothetical protein